MTATAACRGWASVLVALGLGLSLPAVAQFAPGQAPQVQVPIPDMTLPAMEDPLLILLPQLRTLPAPDWVTEGLRVTYYSAVASVRGNYLLSPLDGANRSGPDDPPGGAGEGYWQNDLVALDAQTAAQHVTMYNVDMNRRVTMPLFTMPQQGLPGYCGTWANPRAFENAEQLRVEGVSVAKLQYTVQGRNYDAIRIEQNTFAGEGPARVPASRTVNVFDLRTGLMLFTSVASHSPQTDSTLLAHQEYRAHRVLNLPWQNGTAPDWVRQGGQMVLDGTHTMHMAGSPAIPLKCRAVVETRQRGPEWSVHRTTTYINDAFNSQSNSLTGAAQLFGGHWISAAAHGALREGLVLDQDPITGSRVVVNAVGTDPRGTPAVQITETCGQWSLTLGYDRRDGSLVSSYTQTPMPFSTIVQDLYRTGPPN